MENKKILALAVIGALLILGYAVASKKADTGLVAAGALVGLAIADAFINRSPEKKYRFIEMDVMRMNVPRVPGDGLLQGQDEQYASELAEMVGHGFNLLEKTAKIAEEKGA